MACEPFQTNKVIDFMPLWRKAERILNSYANRMMVYGADNYADWRKSSD